MGDFKSRFGVVGLALIAAAAPLLGQGARAAETRSFVVNWFYLASYFSDADCPDGLNPSAAEFYRSELARIGHPKAEIEAALKDFPGEGGAPQPWIALVAVRGDGKTNVYAAPETGPDPNLKVVKGQYAFGFNLDGRGAQSPNSFEDPITHERGVNNQLYRAFGCVRGFRGVAKAADQPGMSNSDEVHWDKLKDVMPAMLVSVTAENGFAKDGDVTVLIGRALEPITRDASGAGAQRDMTYRIDPDPRTRNLFHATMRDGVITGEPGTLSLVVDNYYNSAFKFDHARLRLQLKPNGELAGMIGGYTPWFPLYHAMAVGGYVEEYALSADLPGLYYAMKKLADADPDPKTGENRSISAAYAIDAVPAFVIDQAVSKTAANEAR
jgi:hypothetical protein